MTTSDRAGNEAEPLTADDEAQLRAQLQAGTYWLGPARLARLLATLDAARAAALAATPTQTGAEGPAADDSLELALYQAEKWAQAADHGSIEDGPAFARGVRSTAKLLAALRSGAEVAAAPELSVDEKMLRWVAAQPVGFGDWACRDCRPDSDMIVDDFRCMVHEARARLTAKP